MDLEKFRANIMKKLCLGGAFLLVNILRELFHVHSESSLGKSETFRGEVVCTKKKVLRPKKFLEVLFGKSGT